MTNQIKIPKGLQELHGKQTTKYDLVITYIAAVLSTLGIMVIAYQYGLPLIKYILLGFLVMDLAGGVVSNFTRGTSAYYASDGKMRLIFIVLHVVQPLLLCWIFPGEWKYIAIISAYSITAMLFVNATGTYQKQKPLAALLLLIGLFLTITLYTENEIIKFMLSMFNVKLIISFAVRWP